MSLRKIIKESLEDFEWVNEIEANPWLDYKGIIFDVKPTPEDVNKYIEMALNTVERISNVDAWDSGREYDIRNIIEYQEQKGHSYLVVGDWFNHLQYAPDIEDFPNTKKNEWVKYSSLKNKNISESTEWDWIKSEMETPPTLGELIKTKTIKKGDILELRGEIEPSSGIGKTTTWYDSLKIKITQTGGRQLSGYSFDLVNPTNKMMDDLNITNDSGLSFIQSDTKLQVISITSNPTN